MWYDPLFIFLGIIGILLIVFSSYTSKQWVWGLVLLLASALGRALIWFFSLAK